LGPAEIGKEGFVKTDKDGIGIGSCPDDRCRTGEDAFGEEKTEGQLGIMAGSAHGQGNILFDAGCRGSVLQADLEGLFDGDGVSGLDELAGLYLMYGQDGDPGG
jgi:hypothetical protein